MFVHENGWESSVQQYYSLAILNLFGAVREAPYKKAFLRGSIRIMDGMRNVSMERTVSVHTVLRIFEMSDGIKRACVRTRAQNHTHACLSTSL